jgi:thimet oligopeptidase
MIRISSARLAALVVACTVCLPLLAASPPSLQLHAWEGGDDAAALKGWVHHHLTRAEADVARLLAVKGTRSVENTLRPYDDAFNELIFAQQQSSVLYGVGASKALRDAAQALTQEASAASTALSLNQAVYRALAAVPTPADAATRQYLEHTLLEYRLAGVDKDDATRAKVKELQDRITARGLAFERAVHDDVRSVVVDKSALDGLPPDYIAAHAPDAQGHVKITTDPPDARPVARFANSADVRLKMFLASASVAWPANDKTLRELLEARAELAHLLGYATWADLAMADQMMGSPARLAEYLAKVDAASREPARREDAALLAFARERDAQIERISDADVAYWTEQYRRAKFNFDSQAVRPYFPYPAVERGVLDTAARLFHLEFRAVEGVKTWHPSVTVYDVYDAGERLGRIYLDMHPREGKDKWFSTQLLMYGIRGRQMPEGALVCNFPGGIAGDPGLMERNDVVVFLHEFGHLMHLVLSGRTQFAGQGAFNIENDFVEAPSQMLEEFFHDYGVLASFAHHYETGAVLPQELFARMERASAYGRATSQQRQLAYSAVSLDFHTLPPATLDFDAQWRHDQERYTAVAMVPGDHEWASFTHLNGYSSNYYTYVIDKVIAEDFFAQFDRNDLLGGPAGMRYRHSVLEPGATKPAAQLVRDFLGREPSLTAYQRWLMVEFEAPATTSSSAR